jgi:hypothetical protein
MLKIINTRKGLESRKQNDNAQQKPSMLEIINTQKGLERIKQNDNTQQKPSVLEIINTFKNKQETEVVHFCRGYNLETIQYSNIEYKAKCE